MWILTENGNAAEVGKNNYIIVIPSFHKSFYAAVAVVEGTAKVLLQVSDSENRTKEYVAATVERLNKIEEYNRQNVFPIGPWKMSVALRNMLSSRILNKNCFWFMSCNGALPIRDDNLHIPLLPEFKPKFDELKLDKYITIYTDIAENEKDHPKVKSWPIRYFMEYIARMKKRFPDVEIVQCGGSNDVKVENADRHYLGVDLELTKYILANSLLHVGSEGGLVHLATFLGTKCLALFGPNSVEYFGYPQNINLVSEVCQPCVYILPTFQVCMRGNLEPPCMLSHTPQTVCEVTCTYLKNKA